MKSIEITTAYGQLRIIIILNGFFTVGVSSFRAKQNENKKSFD
jgi:hypothetical protein